LDFWDFGFLVVVGLVFFLVLDLGEGEGLEDFGLRMEAKEG
jgi:hypothetical protein